MVTGIRLMIVELVYVIDMRLTLLLQNMKMDLFGI